MCCGRQLETEGYSSVCPGCCTLSHLRLHGKPGKGKWLKKMLRIWSQGGGEGGSSLAYKTGGEGQGGTGQGAEKIKEKGGQSLQGIIVQAWGGLTLELKRKKHPARKKTKPAKP